MYSTIAQLAKPYYMKERLYTELPVPYALIWLLRLQNLRENTFKNIASHLETNRKHTSCVINI
jgi:hypothetical protein